jgi:uncharacterized protein (DUF433 family)
VIHHHFTRDPAVCGGQPVVKGASSCEQSSVISHGEPVDVILRDFPSLTDVDVRAVIAFAAAAASEDLPAREAADFPERDAADFRNHQTPPSRHAPSKR